MKIIFNNDDYGLSHGFTEAIRNCYKNGLTRSTSIRVNGVDINRALKFFNKDLKHLGRGLHLNLTDGSGYTKELIDIEGRYRHNFVTYLILLFLKPKKYRSLISREFEKQYQLIKKADIQIDHVDGQDHIHMIPQVFEIACKFCRKHKIKAIRLVREPFYLPRGISPQPLSCLKFIILNFFAQINIRVLSKYRLKTTNACYGVLYTNRMNTRVIRYIIEDAIKRNFESIEIFSHPAYTHQNQDTVYVSSFTKWYANLPNRLIEAKTLINSTLKKIIFREKLQLTSFSDLQ